jgi:hypothetical protein
MDTSCGYTVVTEQPVCLTIHGVEASMVMQWTVNPPPSGTPGSIPGYSTSFSGDVAQLGEQLLCKQKVRGSIPLFSTNLIKDFIMAHEAGKGSTPRPFSAVSYTHLRAHETG